MCEYSFYVKQKLKIQQQPSEYRTPEYQTVWVSGIQMVKSCDMADHSDTQDFGLLTGFFCLYFQATIL